MFLFAIVTTFGEAGQRKEGGWCRYVAANLRSPPHYRPAPSQPEQRGPAWVTSIQPASKVMQTDLYDEILTFLIDLQPEKTTGHTLVNTGRHFDIYAR